MARVGRYTAAAAVVTILVTGCATMGIGSFVERGTDFTRYRTYEWGPADALPTGDPRLDNNPVFNDYFQGAVDRQLAVKRLDRALSGTPDLLIHYHASVSQRVDDSIDQRYGYCGPEGCSPRVTVSDVSTLVIDVVDKSTNRLIWRGWAEDNLRAILADQDQMEKRINEAVIRMMAQFPAGR
jgi:hypothetical protein